MSETIVRIIVEEGISTEEHREKLNKAESFIMSKGDKSVLMLTILEEKSGNSQIVENHKAFSKRVSPKIKKSAVVGLSLASGIALKTIKLVTGRQIKAFSSENEAVNWLRS